MNFDPILYGPLFVRDAPDVNLVASGADPVEVTVAVGGSNWTIPVTPVLKDGSYVAPLRMREILASVVDIPGLADAGVRDVPLVTLSAGGASMSFRVVYGSAAGRTPAQLAGHWLTWRDQVSKTQPWGRERLTFLAGKDLLGWQSGTYTVRAKVFFASGDPETVTLASGTLQSGCCYVTVDASYAAIAAAVQSVGIITAWDVSYAFSGQNSSGAVSVDGYPLRLVVARKDVRVKEFIFCNSFGVEDRVYSSGRSNPKLEGLSVAFLNGGSESELRNDAKEGKEVYSGHISSARDSALWTDFLKARDRHILLSGSLEQIVVDSHETDLQDNAIGSVKFTYHLAKLDTGRFFQDAEGLGNYDPGQQYGALYVGDDPAAEELPSEDLFFLKTRLDEFPAADLTEELLFLVQNPLTLAWGNASLNGIKAWLQEAISAYQTPVWSGPWEEYTAGVADCALAASLGRDLYDRIQNIERNPYNLPIASASVLGGIKVGTNFSINNDGVLSLAQTVQETLELANTALQSRDIKTLSLAVGSTSLGTFNPVGADNVSWTISAQNLYNAIGSEKYHPYGGSTALSSFKIGGATLTWVPGATANDPGHLYVDQALVTAGDQIVISGTPGSGGGGGATTLASLLDVAATFNPSTGKFLVYDSQATNNDGGTGAWKAADGVLSVAGLTGAVTTAQIATALTNAGYKLTDTVYTHPTGGANTTIVAANGKVLSAITVNELGHVTSVASKTLAAADIPSITKSKISDFPTTWALANITGADDLQAIEALAGTSGLLRKTAANEWALDANTYLTSVEFGDLTSHPNTLAGYGITDAKIENGVITLGGASITPLTSHQTIYNLVIKNSAGTTQLTYKPAVSNTYELTLTKAMVGLGNVENTKLSTWAGSANITKLGTIATGVWHGTPIANDYIANSWVKVGTTQINLGAQQTSLAGLVNVTMTGVLKIGDAELEWDSTNGYLKLNKPFVTTGDQIVNSGTPGGGGGGGGASYLHDLLDVYDHEHEVVKRANGSAVDNDDLLAYNSSLQMWAALPKATLLSGYYTSAQTDSAISTAITALGLGAAATYAVASSVSQNDNTHLVTGAAVWAAIDALPEPMIFKGSLGTGGTIQTLPTASSSNEGWTYKVITDGAYASQAAEVGDLFICAKTGTNAWSWVWIPSGDEPNGTVTSVALSVPTGLSVSGSPITTSGTIAISFASGYSIPTTANQTAWSNKYDKPSGGIPKTDLASAVQTSLGLADTALQTHQSVTLTGGTNNGTLKLTTAAGAVDNIAVTGLGNAAYKGVSDSSSASAISTGTNLVTERDVYYGLPKINNKHNYTSSTSIYAPTAGGATNKVLIGNGTTTAPDWSSFYITGTSGDTYALDTIASNASNGNTAYNSLGNYVLKAGDTMSGNLTFTRTFGIQGYDAASNGTARSLLYLSSNNNLIIGIGMKDVSSGSGNTYLYGSIIRFRTAALGASSHTEAMMINASQNVTIGSSDLASTTYRFYVSGNSYMSGTLGVTGLATLSGGATIPPGQTLVIGGATLSWNSDGYLHIDKPLVTAGDQIVLTGTPGGGGGGSTTLASLLDVAASFNPSTGYVILYDAQAQNNDGGTGAWTAVASSTIGRIYTQGTGISISNTNVISLNVSGAKTALGLGTMAYEASADYVPKASAVTVSANHTFSAGITLNTGSSWSNSDRALFFSADGASANLRYYNVDSNKGLTYNPSSGALKAGSFVKRGGTSSQFLKADGSVDSNAYITGNQTITLSGDVSGSGTTSIAVSIGSGKVTNTMLAGSINWSKLLASSIPTTISGYGITDAKFGTAGTDYVPITLGSTTKNVLTAHQSVTLESGTNNGTLKLTVNGTATNNIEVKGLGTMAYESSGDYVSAVSISGNYLRVRKNGSNTDLTIPYATLGKRLTRYTGTDASGGYDLNTLLAGGGITSQYGSASYWANGPSGMSFGAVAQINASSTNTLCAQFAWDINHNSATPTRRIWWRSASSTHGWQSDWHQIYDSYSLTKSVITGLLDAGDGTYLPLSGGTMTGDITMTNGEFINAASGYAMLGMGSGGTTFFCGPGYEVSNTFAIRSGNINLTHRKFSAANTSTDYTIWDAANSNLSTVDWTVNKLYVGTGGSTGDSYIASDSASNIYLRNSSGAVLVAAAKVIRRGTTLSDVTLGSVTYPWGGVFTTDLSASGNITVAGTSTFKDTMYLDNRKYIYWANADSSANVNILGFNNANQLLIGYGARASYQTTLYGNPIKLNVNDVNIVSVESTGASLVGTLTMDAGNAIRWNNSNSVACTVLSMGSYDYVYLAYGAAGEGSSTYIYGNDIKFHATTSRTLIATIDSTGLSVTGAVSASGAGTFDTITLTNATAAAHLAFGRGSANYITAPASGSINFVPNGLAVSSANSRLSVSDNEVVITKASGAAMLAIQSTSANVASGSIWFRARSTSFNGIKLVGSQGATSNAYDRISLDFMAANGTSSSNVTWKRALRITYAGNVIVGASGATSTFTQYGNMTVNGDITSTGDQTVSSDALLKMNWRPLRYGVKEIAKATAGVFDWIDGHGSSAGTKAQDWVGLVPELVHGKEGCMSLAYGQLALVNTVLIARHETEQDKEINRLKLRVEELEVEVKQLRS